MADLIEPFEEVHLGVTWAQTAPLATSVVTAFNSTADVPFLREAAEVMQSKEEPEEFHEVNMTGYVEVLRHPKPVNSARTVTIKATFQAKHLTATAVLQPEDYSRALKANENKANVIVSAERLFKNGRSWQLQGARIDSVIPPVKPEAAPDLQKPLVGAN